MNNIVYIVLYITISIIIIYQCLQEKIDSLNAESQSKGNQVFNNVVIGNQSINNINFSNYLGTRNCYVNDNNEDSDDDEDEGEAIDMDSFLESGLLEDASVISFYTKYIIS